MPRCARIALDRLGRPVRLDQWLCSMRPSRANCQVGWEPSNESLECTEVILGGGKEMGTVEQASSAVLTQLYVITRQCVSSQWLFAEQEGEF